jgi:hypothetical protein
LRFFTLAFTGLSKKDILEILNKRTSNSDQSVLTVLLRSPIQEKFKLKIIKLIAEALGSDTIKLKLTYNFISELNTPDALMMF